MDYFDRASDRSRIHKAVVLLTPVWQRPAMISKSRAASRKLLALFVIALSSLMAIATVERPVSEGLTGTIQRYFPPPDRAGGLRTATNVRQMRERTGMDLRKLNQTWEFTQRCTPGFPTAGQQ